MDNTLKTKIFDFVGPVVVGLMGFVLVAGLPMLRFENIAWLGGALDPAQHYLGWALFRHGPWTMPLGLNPNNGIEFSNAVVFSDSLPIFAILFKALNFILPEVFQYFGLWTLICFLLQAWFAWKLIGLVSDSMPVKFFGAGLFVFSPTLMLRVGLWTSLASHFLILAALYLIFRPNQSRRKFYWPILIGLAALVHFYLLAMVLALWLASFLDYLIRNKTQSIGDIIAELIITIIVLISCLYMAGYFSVSTGSGSAGGYGTFRLNLLAPFDSRGWSFILRPIPTQIDFGNGFNYFGLGILIATCFALLARIKKHAFLPPFLSIKANKFLYICFICLTCFAITNTISAGPWKFTFALPETFLSFASLLRASGRMFWPVFYFLVFISIAYIVKGFSKKSAIIILGACFLVQVIDTSPGWRSIHRSLKAYSSINQTPLTNPIWSLLGSHYQKLIRYPVRNQANDWQYFASFAALHKMATNSVFLARLDESKLQAADEKINSELRNDRLDSESLYVLDLWKTNPAPLYFDPTVDLLMNIDGYTVLAPGWKIRTPREMIEPGLEIARYMPFTRIGERIYFGRHDLGRKEFLLDGWAPYGEAWGNWSEGGVASMLLPIPAGNPKSLRLTVRAFVHERHPTQDIEIFIDGVLQRKIALSNFENNIIDLPISSIAIGKKYFKLDFKMLNPSSPKSIGVGEDDRQLGIGLISAVFE